MFIYDKEKLFYIKVEMIKHSVKELLTSSWSIND